MAHRGGAEYSPNLGKENTLHGFHQAVSLGYRYLETDLQATKDGLLVCFHDETLDRMAGLSGRVSDYTADELKNVTIGGEPIPFFTEVVEVFPQTRFNVDLKTNDCVLPLVAMLDSYNLADRILVDSFSQQRISAFRQLSSPRIPTAMAPLGVAWTALVPYLSGVVSSPGVALQVPVRNNIGPFNLQVISPEVIDRVHALGKVIHAWTINDAHEMNVLIDWGIDGIITDRPDVLKEILISRNLWEDE
jgi:glycerophosphoryl diester phosphodiesterase